MIPKIIHYVWVGDKEKPEFVLKCIDSWKKYCPDYEIMEWNNEKFEKIKNEYSQQAYENKKWAFVSDYIRLYALYNYGGVYLDTDSEITQNIDKFLSNEFFTGFEVYKNKFGIMASPIGVIPKNKIIKDILEYYQTNSFITKKGIDTTTINKRMSQYLEKEYNIKQPYDGEKTLKLKDGCIIYPYYYFCQKKEAHENYAIHHYQGSWLDRYKRKNILSIGKYTLSVFKEVDKTKKSLPISSKEIILKKYKITQKKSLVLIKKFSHPNPQKQNDNDCIKNNPAISIIIPVYNVEKYLTDCLDSVINQTFKNYEIICINDGSTDNSGEILKKYQNQYPQIKIIEQKNQGLAAARNQGLNNTKGNYFFFLDSDDYIHPQTLELLYYMIQKNNIDIVACSFEKTNKTYKESNFENIKITTNSKPKIIKNPLKEFTKLKSTLSPSVWTNLYKKEKFGDIRFIEGYVWEDVYYTLQCFDRINEIFYTDLKLYKYVQNQQSISLNAYSTKKIDSHIKNIYLINEYFRNKEKKVQNIKEKLIANSVRRVINDVTNSKNFELKVYLKKELRKLRKKKLIGYKYLKLSKWLVLWRYLND